MSIFEGLRFRTGESFVHKLDPRVKFTLSISILVIATMYLELLPLALLLMAQIPLVAAGKVGKNWMKTLRGSLTLAAFVFVVNLVLSYFTAGYVLDLGQVYSAFLYAFRLVVLFTSFSIFFLTTTPDELGLTLTSWKVPYDFTFAFVTAVRFVPVLAQELQMILDAQKSRGLELERGNFIQRIRNFIPVLVPLIVNIFRRSIELAEAMEVKAFGATKKRTSLRELRMRRTDYVFFAFIVALLCLGTYVRYFVSIPRLVPQQI